MMPESMIYLVDILDSAQEASPFMWVNGEKYMFSDHIITKGVELYQNFQEMSQTIPDVRSLPELYSLKSLMEAFDAQWCKYELAYVGELMVIERDARRFIYDLTESKEDPVKFISCIG